MGVKNPVNISRWINQKQGLSFVQSANSTELIIKTKNLSLTIDFILSSKKNKKTNRDKQYSAS